jgi:hypothetical protein
LIKETKYEPKSSSIQTTKRLLRRPNTIWVLIIINTSLGTWFFCITLIQPRRSFILPSEALSELLPLVVITTTLLSLNSLIGSLYLAPFMVITCAYSNLELATLSLKLRSLFRFIRILELVVRVLGSLIRLLWLQISLLLSEVSLPFLSLVS